MPVHHRPGLDFEEPAEDVAAQQVARPVARNQTNTTVDTAMINHVARRKVRSATSGDARSVGGSATAVTGHGDGTVVAATVTRFGASRRPRTRPPTTQPRSRSVPIGTVQATSS